MRDMVVEDLPTLIDLWVASWREAMPAIDFGARRGWIATFLADRRHRTWIGVGGAAPLGFASIEADYLHQLVVSPAAKGTGVATRLLATAKGHAPAGLTLDVNQANPRAVRFYAREWFETIDAGNNPVSGLPTWRMRWRP